MPRSAAQVRALMLDLTPLVEPVSIDEAFMDLSGTERLHGVPPAKSLARFRRPRRARARHHRVDRAFRATSSWPRSPPISTSRAASRCSARDEAAAFLATKPGHADLRRRQGRRRRASQGRLRDRSATCSAPARRELMRRYGGEGARLFRLAHGRDERPVRADREAKSVSAETTFDARHRRVPAAGAAAVAAAENACPRG